MTALEELEEQEKSVIALTRIEKCILELLRRIEKLEDEC